MHMSSGRLSLSKALPYLTRFPIRFMSTVVFPLPAPAKISTGPSVWKTACFCMAFILEKSFCMIFFLKSRIVSLSDSKFFTSFYLFYYTFFTRLFQ